MKSKCIKCGIVLLFSSLRFLSAADQPLTQHTVNFTQSHNLKEIFDAGLRPWRMEGGENLDCALGREDLKILLSDNCSFSLIINRAEIGVMAGNELYNVDLFSNLEKAADTAQQAKELCKTFGIATQGLDDFVNGKGNHTDTFWAGDTTKGGVKIHITYDVVTRYNNGYAEIFLTLTWPIPDAQMKFLTAPIKPPPGYENVSMDPPPRDPNQKPVPDPNNPAVRQILSQSPNASDMVPSVGLSSQVVNGTVPTQSTLPSSIPSESPAISPQAPPSASWFKPWYGLLAVLLLIATVYALKRK